MLLMPAKMKNLIATLLISCLFFQSFGQTTAITAHGDKVILYDDYTWAYDGEKNSREKENGVRRIIIDPQGIVRVEFWVDQQRVTFIDGRIFYNHLQPSSLDYYQHSISDKIPGKIKQISFKNLTVSFEYHINSIFPKSEGKIKSIIFGNLSYEFEYHQNSFFEKSEGKIKRISRGRDFIEFEFHQNSIFPETEGKLKEIKGEIPGIIIRYTD